MKDPVGCKERHLDKEAAAINAASCRSQSSRKNTCKAETATLREISKRKHQERSQKKSEKKHVKGPSPDRLRGRPHTGKLLIWRKTTTIPKLRLYGSEPTDKNKPHRETASARRTQVWQGECGNKLRIETQDRKVKAWVNERPINVVPGKDPGPNKGLLAGRQEKELSTAEKSTTRSKPRRK